MAGQTVAISVLADTAPFAKAMKGIGIGVGAALGAVAAGVVALGAEAFKAVAEVERLNAQTSAAIASTGSAASRTIEQITGVADSLERMSGVEAEVIQAGQNMLLTFTNIKGDNFDSATKAALDMSVAMGTDMTSAATLVGKALNDPIKGIGALSKVGVQLTDDQKALVQSMVDMGDVAGAQGVILGVLGEQFGGSAEAFGGTFLGTVEKVKNSSGALTEAFVVGMLPAATAVLSSLNLLMEGLADSPAFAAVVESVNSFVGSLFSGEGAIGSFAGQAIALVTSVSPLSILLQAITPLLPQLADMFAMLASTIGGTLITLLPTLTGLAGMLAGTLTGVLAAALPPIAQLISQLAGVLSFLIPALAPIITMLGETLTTSLTTLAPIMATVAATVGGVLGTALSALGPVIVLVAATFGELMTALMPLVAAILPLVSAVLMLIEPIAALISAILPPVIGLFVALLRPILLLIAPLVQLLTPAIQLVSGVLVAIVGIIAGVIGWFVQLVTGGQKASRGFTDAFSGVAGFFGNLVGSVTGFFAELPGRILGIFAGAGRWLYDVGRNIIEGLMGGAGSLLRNLGRFFLDLVPSFIREPFKQALGIRSPSRVFRGFGVNVVEGLAIGLQQLRPVHRAVEALSTAVVDGYTPPGAVGAAQVASDARTNTTSSGAAPDGVAGNNVTELGAATLQALAQLLGLTVTLDGAVMATSASRQFAQSTMLGAA